MAQVFVLFNGKNRPVFGAQTSMPPPPKERPDAHLASPVAGRRVTRIANMALGLWLRGLRDFYKSGDIVGLNDAKYIDRFLARPAVQRGLTVPKKV